MTDRVQVSGHSRRRGQALVEFALVLPIFIILLVGVFDLGRGIYALNGVSEAARDIARATAVHPGVTLGQSAESIRAVDTQRALVPGMIVPPTFSCVRIDDTPSTNNPCASGDFVKVTVQAQYAPIITRWMGGPVTFTSSSSVQIP